MNFTLTVAAFLLSFCTSFAQGWSPIIRSTEKVAIKFWQKDLPPIAFRDAQPDSILGFRMYGLDTTNVVAMWNFKGPDGMFNETVFVDLDQDGYNDCISTTVVYLRAGTPLQTSYSIPFTSYARGLADVDGDGMVDVLGYGYESAPIHYGDGQRALMRKKILTHGAGLTRASYVINYMDTLGSKVLFLTSWAVEINQDENDVTVAVETLDPEELQKVGDTARLRMLHSFTYRSSIHSLGSAPTFIFDDVWYITGKAITADTITPASPDSSFRLHNGKSVGINTYRPNNDGLGNVITVVDGRKPVLVYRYEPLDTSYTLRYVTLKSRNPILSAQTIGDLNVNLGPGGKSVRTTGARYIADVDGDGIEDICNAVSLPGIENFSYDIYLTNGNVVSSVIQQTNPMALPVASRVESGWLIRAMDACANLDAPQQAYVYNVEGRLLNTLMLRDTDEGFLLSDVAVTTRGLLIAVVGNCMVRLQ